MTLGTEHARPNSALKSGAGTACTRCHNADATASSLVKSSWTAKSGDRRPASRATPRTATARIHALDRSGARRSRAGTDRRRRRPARARAAAATRHSTCACCTRAWAAPPRAATPTRATSSAATRRAAAESTPTPHVTRATRRPRTSRPTWPNASGTVNGVDLQRGRERGLLRLPRRRPARRARERAARRASSTAAARARCAICHADVSGAGAYASLPAVKSAIANHDMRCSACHASGSAHDGPDAVASAHKEISTATRLPAGKVWSDPFQDWKAAFDATTGSGHNGLPRSLVGGATDKRFPLTQFSIEGTTFTLGAAAQQRGDDVAEGLGVPAGLDRDDRVDPAHPGDVRRLPRAAREHERPARLGGSDRDRSRVQPDRVREPDAHREPVRGDRHQARRLLQVPPDLRGRRRGQHARRAAHRCTPAT